MSNYPKLYFRKCGTCKKNFRGYDYKGIPKKYCSRECWNKRPSIGLGRNRMKILCKECGVAFMVKKSHASRRRFCSLKCKGEWMTTNWKGSKAPNWQGGIYPESQRIRRTKAYKEWRKSVFQVYGKKCLMCLDEENIHAHHTIPFSERPDLVYDVSNGAPFCGWCHRMLHAKHCRPTGTTVEV